MDDRALLDLIPFLEHLATPKTDVRVELDKYGHENPSSKFIEVQTARKNAIMQQREKGFGGMIDRMGQSQYKVRKFENHDMDLPSKFKSE